MNISQVLSRATAKLKKANISLPALDAEILLSHIFQKKREYLFAHPKENLSLNEIKEYKKLIRRRQKGEPIAYLTHTKQFYGLDFYVDKNVLIPRPETELMIEEAKKIISSKQKTLVIDLGTGSGCLAITLAKLFPNLKIWATDISEEALRVAQKNARWHKVSKRIKFIQSNLLLSVPCKIWLAKNPKIILANLPYLDSKTYQKFQANLKYEPPLALLGGKNGLKYYCELVHQLQKIISHHPSPLFLILEINPNQKSKIKKIITSAFHQTKIKIKKDLAGLNRIVTIEMF